MDKELEDALDRLSNSDCVEDQVNAEIIRYWNNRIHQDDDTASKVFRKLVYEFIYDDIE